MIGGGSSPNVAKTGSRVQTPALPHFGSNQPICCYSRVQVWACTIPDRMFYNFRTSESDDWCFSTSKRRLLTDVVALKLRNVVSRDKTFANYFHLLLSSGADFLDFCLNNRQLLCSTVCLALFLFRRLTQSYKTFLFPSKSAKKRGTPFRSKCPWGYDAQTTNDKTSDLLCCSFIGVSWGFLF